VPAMARKWKQINKFVEVLGHALDDAGLASASALRVLDFGSGKGYLTFAVHDHLQRRGIAPDVVGVELRDDLVVLCNGALQRLGLQGLRFEHGDVRSHASAGVDIMIALHACDTATDDALLLALRHDADHVAAVPCCQAEVAAQLKENRHAAPQPWPLLWGHAIHRREMGAHLTNVIRALALQSHGYQVTVTELTGWEHSLKNELILARRVHREHRGARAELQKLLETTGVRPKLIREMSG